MPWDDIIGQKRVVNILKRAIVNNRIAGAYLFIGPDDVGKHLVAKEFARALNCEKNFGDACGQCISCSKIGRDIYPDVSVISPQGQGIKIEQIHRIKDYIFLKPLEGRYKFYIIDKAEGLQRPREEAGNALLKLLEEPPSDTVFILIPTEGQMLLSTLISRCQKLRFDCPPLSFKNEEMRKEREEVYQNLNKPFLKSLLTWAKDLAQFREKVMDVLDIMQIWFRDILVFKITHKDELLVNVDYIKDIQKEEDSIQNLIKKINLVQKTKKLIEHNVNLQLALEVMFMEMTEV